MDKTSWKPKVFKATENVDYKVNEVNIERGGSSMKIDGKNVIKIWESFSGWYWYAIEDQGSYTGIGADGNEVQAHAWYGYVQGMENEWGTWDSNELERAGVWTVPKSNWGWTGKESKASEVNGYIAYYDGQQTEIYADTSYDAQKKAIDFFNPPESKKHTVTVMIAEKDGEQVTHTFTESKASEKGETYHFMWNHKEVRSQLLAQAGLSDEHSNKEWDEIPEEDKTVLKLIMNDMFYSINESKSSEGYFVEWGYDLDYDFEEIDDIDEAKQLAKDNGGNVYLNDKLVYSVIPSIKDDPTNDKSRFIVANNLMGVEKVRTQEESKASEGFPSEGTSNYEFLWKHFDFVRSMDQDDIGCKICGYQLRPFGVYAYEDKIMGEAKNHMLKHGIGSGSYQKRSGESKASEYDCEACGGEYSNCPHCGHGMHDYEWERENGTCDSCEKSKYDESKASEGHRHRWVKEDETDFCLDCDEMRPTEYEMGAKGYDHGESKASEEYSALYSGKCKICGQRKEVTNVSGTWTNAVSDQEYPDGNIPSPTCLDCYYDIYGEPDGDPDYGYEAKATEISTIDRLRSWDKSEWHQKDINYGYTDSEWNMMSQEEQNRIVDKYEDEIEDKWNNMSDEEKNSYESKASEEYSAWDIEHAVIDDLKSFTLEWVKNNQHGGGHYNETVHVDERHAVEEIKKQFVAIAQNSYDGFETSNVAHGILARLVSEGKLKWLGSGDGIFGGGVGYQAKEGFNQGLYGHVDAKCKTCGIEFDSIPDMDDHYAMNSDHISNLDDLDSDIPNSD